MNPPEDLRAALQRFLDTFGDGWQVDHFVVVFGLERMREDDCVEHVSWMWAPAEQPAYVTDGLLDAALEASPADIED